MIALVSAILGLFTSILPEGLEFFKRRQDHQHEIDMMRVQAELAAQAGEMRMREAELAVDTAHMQGVYAQAAGQRTDTWVDRLNALVRPLVTITFLAMFLMVVASTILQSVAFGSTIPAALSVILPMIEAYFSAILAFWFGNRTIEKRRRG